MADGAAQGGPVQGIKVFRRDEGQPHRAGPQGGLTDVSRAGLARVFEAGLGEGAETRCLFEAPGFTLMYVWFKSGFPLYRHSHGPDCLYEVIGGSLQMGEDVLKKGDGFFIPAGTPYTFTVGPQGVEILEFRHEPIRDSVVRAHNPAFWDKAVETIRTRREAWSREPRPV
jgi:hypothetical protein